MNQWFVFQDTADSVNESLSIPTLDLDTQDSILDSTTTSMTSVSSHLAPTAPIS